KNYLKAQRLHEVEMDAMEDRHTYEMNMLSEQYKNRILQFSLEVNQEKGYWEGRALALLGFHNGELSKLVKSHRRNFKAQESFEIVNGKEQVEIEQLKGQIAYEKNRASNYERRIAELKQPPKEIKTPSTQPVMRSLKSSDTIPSLDFHAVNDSSKYNIEELSPGKYTIHDKRTGIVLGHFDFEELQKGQKIVVAPSISYVWCAHPSCDNVKHTSQHTRYCSKDCRESHKHIQEVQNA
ncbi:MAG: hypothetical protein AAF696_35905, partial [Bacteroidota bacterium]